MHNPLLNLDRYYDDCRCDVLAGLRDEIQSWLASPNRTQEMLAKRSGITPQMLCDVLANRRGCSPKTYEKIIRAMQSNGNRITELQEGGHKIHKSMQLDEHNMATIHARHSKQLLESMKASNDDRNCGTFEVNCNRKTLSK